MNQMPSGHSFQYKIEDRVGAINGWKTLSEQSYIDDVELKPRTIDFVALQKREGHNPRGDQLALVVECKFLNQDVYVYERPNPKDKKAYFIDGYSTQDLFVDEYKFHFFRTARVVTNITKEKDKKDNLGGAITQAIKAMLYLRGHNRVLDSKGLFFPVVVYGGTAKIFDQEKNQLDNFLYYLGYEWKEPHSQNRAETRQMYVDVIHEKNLEIYLDSIFNQEMNIITSYANFAKRIDRARYDGASPQNPAI